MSTATAIPATLPVEFIERSMCFAAEAYRPQLGACIVFESRLDADRLGRAVRLLFDAEPVLGCVFVAEDKPPVWQRLSDLDSRTLFEVLESGDPIADAEAFIAAPIEFTTEPQLRAALMRGSSSDVLAVKVTHVVMDGGALKQALYMLGEFYRRLESQPDWTPEPNVDGLRHPKVKAGLFEKMGALRTSDMTMLPSDWRLPLEDGRDAGTYVSATIEPDTFRPLLAKAKAAGATANDVILTAYYRTLWRLLESKPGERTPLMNAVELRRFLPADTKTALSNIASAWYMSVPPVGDETFDRTLARVRDATAVWKRGGAGKGSAIGIPLISRFTAKKDMESVRKMLFGNTKDVGQQIGGTTNIGVIDEARLDFGPEARIEDAWLLPPISWMIVVLGSTTYRDRLHMSIGAEFSGLGEQFVRGLVSGTAREIEDWAAGEYRPDHGCDRDLCRLPVYPGLAVAWARYVPSRQLRERVRCRERLGHAMPSCRPGERQRDRTRQIDEVAG